MPPSRHRLVVLLLLIVCVAPRSVAADESVVPHIAVLDVERVRRNAAAVKSIQAQLSTYVEAYRRETQKEEQEIRSARDELANKRADLSQEAYADERRKLERRLAEAQGRVQQRRSSLEQVSAVAMQQVQDVLGKVVAELAEQQKWTLILRKDQVVLFAPGLEITDEVLRRLDSRLPTVPISDPGR
jgi:Skp family chaperone for outer membrane proteins